MGFQDRRMITLGVRGRSSSQHDDDLASVSDLASRYDHHARSVFSPDARLRRTLAYCSCLKPICCLSMRVPPASRGDKLCSIVFDCR